MSKLKEKLRTVDEVIASMPKRFHPEECQDVEAQVYWNISGKDPKQFTIVINKGSFKIQYGENTNADLSLEADSETYLKLVNKEMKGMIAVLTRRLRARGKMQLAPKMERIFV